MSQNHNLSFNRDYLLRLPLPIAQLYGRSYNAKTDRERHDNAFYLFEAWIKLAASTCTAYYLEEVTRGSVPRVAMLDRLLAQLAIPSLGQWLAILRELTKYYATRVDAAENPFGKIWGQLNATKREPSALLALFRRIKNGPDNPPSGDQSCSLYQVLDAIVQYRNAVFGHGAGRFESFYAEEMGPLLFPALNEMLAAETIAPFGPASSQFAYINELRVIEDGQTEVELRALIGTQGERLPPVRLDSEQAKSLLPNRICLIWPGRQVPLRLDPMLVFRESDLTEDVLFLNRDRNGKQVEYLSYTTGRTERDRSMQPAMAALLSQVTNRAIGEEDLKHLSEQSLAESMSVDSLFAIEPITTQELGEYELLAELGRGGMGVVYLARQASLGRLVALKMLPQDLSADEVALARFKREIRNLAQCDDPHIIKIISSGIFPDGRPYYTMEYVPGSDLEGVWRELSQSGNGGSVVSSTTLGTKTWTEAAFSASRKQREKVAERSHSGSKSGEAISASPEPIATNRLPLPPLPQVPNVEDDPGGYVRWVVMLMRDIARALQTVHDRGIIHRDIKPANLLLTSDGTRAVLMDFGLAKDVVSSMAASRHGGLLGTLRYAAPEQLAAANMKIGPTVDVRGLGVTMWELLTRQRLFGASEDEANLTQEVLTSDVPRLRTIDPKFDRDLDAIVARATERRIVDRIQTAGHLADLMQLWLDGKSLPIRPLSITERAFRWAREHAPLASASAVVLALVCITGGLLFRDSIDQVRQSQAAWQQFSEQSKRLSEVSLPEFSTLLQQINVPFDTAHIMLDSIDQQTKAVRTIANSENLVGALKQKADDLAKKLETSASESDIRLKAVETLSDAQRQRLIVNEESYRSADGLPIIFGRGAFPKYRDVITQLSGTQSFQDLEVVTLATKLRRHEITEHLRLAIDEWFSLSYAYDEQPIREWLASLANELDSGDEKFHRQAIRTAILTHNEDAIVAQSDAFIESSVESVEQFYTGLMISDGLFENLRLQQAMEVLRHLRSALQNKDLSVPVFASRWATHVLGILLSHAGSQEQLHEAAQCFEAVSAVDPNFDMAFLAKSRVYHMLAKPEKAFEMLERVQSPELQLHKVWIQGVLAASVGKTNDARALGSQLQTQFPDSVMAYVAAADVFNRLHDFAAANESFRRALQLDPTNPQLISNVFDKTDSEFQVNMAKVPPERLKRFLGAKTSELYSDLRQAKKVDDYEAMQRARSQLRILGVQDWQIDYQEFLTLFGSAELNLDWEQLFRNLRNSIPNNIAESIPNPMIAALANEPASLGSEAIRRVVLRDVESATDVYPVSRYSRLRAAAILLRYKDKDMAIRFYEGAIRAVSNLRELGYGNEEYWKGEEQALDDNIITLDHPERIDISDPEGQMLLLRTLRNVGLSQYRSNDFPAAEKTIVHWLRLAEALAKRKPNDVAIQCDVALAVGFLALTKTALTDSDSGLALSNRDIQLSESIVQKFSNVRESQMNLVRGYDFQTRVLNRPDQIDQKLQAITKALDLLEAIVKQRPNDGDAQSKMMLFYETAGSIHYDKSDYETAERFYEKALPIAEKRMTAEPNNSKAVSDLITVQTRLGKTAFGMKNIVGAAERFKTASKISQAYVVSHQEDLNFLYLLANSLHWSYKISSHQSQSEDELEYLKQEIAVRKRLRELGESDASELLRAIVTRVAILKKDGRFDDALAELNDGIRRLRQDSDLLFVRGLIRYSRSEYQLAIDDYTRAIELNSNDAQYFYSRANAYWWSEKYDLAEKDCTQAIELDGSNANYFFLRGEVYAWLAKNELAEKDYTRATELGPDDESRWRARAGFYFSVQRWREAAQDYEKWLGFTPTDIQTLNFAGISFSLIENFDRAAEVYQRLVQLQPETAQPFRSLGITFASQKKWELAAENYAKSMSLNGRFPESWSEAILVAKARQDNRQEDIFREMLSRYLTEPSPENANLIVWTSVRFPGSEQDNERLKTWSHLWLADSKDNPLTPKVQGALALRTGDFATAEKQLRAWLEMEPNQHDTVAKLLLTISLSKRGHSQDAKDLLKKTKEERTEQSARSDAPMTPAKLLQWADEIEFNALADEAARAVENQSTDPIKRN